MDGPDHMTLTVLGLMHLIPWFVDERLRLEHGIPARAWDGNRRSRDPWLECVGGF